MKRQITMAQQIRRRHVVGLNMRVLTINLNCYFQNKHIVAAIFNLPYNLPQNSKLFSIRQHYFKQTFFSFTSQCSHHGYIAIMATFPVTLFTFDLLYLI